MGAAGLGAGLRAEPCRRPCFLSSCLTLSSCEIAVVVTWEGVFLNHPISPQPTWLRLEWFRTIWLLSPHGPLS